MSEAHVCGTKYIFLQLDSPLQFELSRVKETEDFFCRIAEISDRI